MFDMVDIGHGQIMLFKKHPSEKDVEDFDNISKVEIGLLYYHKQILLAFNTDTLKCLDMVYAPQLSQVVTMEELHDYPEPEAGLAINLLLLDSVSGEIKGMRLLSTDVKFHKKFAEAVRDKMETFYSKAGDMAAMQVCAVR